MNLHFTTTGKGPPLVILHGLFGSGETWGSMSRLLGARFKVFAVDLRNHGRSPHSDIFDYDVMSTDLRYFVAQQALAPVLLLGHSMGGKLAMRFAIDHPDQVDKLVVVDIAPKSSPPSQRYVLDALRSLDLTLYESFAELDAALANDITERQLRQFLLKNIRRDPDRRFHWKIGLEAIYRNYDQLGRGIAPNRTFDKPALFIRGGRSSYIEASDAISIRRIFPRAEIATLDEAGHWVHVDLPERFFQTVSHFLNEA